MDAIVLSVNAVGGFNDEEFYKFCQDNDPQTETVYVYQPGRETQTVQPFRGELSGGEVLPGFCLQLAELLS